VAIRVIVRDVPRVRVFTNRHALTTRAVSIVEKVKTRAVSVPRALVQAYRALLPSLENIVSHVQAIVLVLIIIKAKKVATSPVSRVIVPVLSMVSRARVSKVVTSPVNRAVISSVVAISLVVTNPVVVTSLVAVINSVLSMVSLVRASRVVTSPVVAISPVSKAVTNPVVVISLVSRVVISSVVAMLPSVVALRSSVAAMIPMPSTR